ncbi:GNAT family N-acetyltransferase [Lactococcus lactis]|uniref:GNAT family N-acetyltransferase n=1 Tax=Lactococcus lactis TaxID=1358 RepID=UPI003D10DFC0
MNIIERENLFELLSDKGEVIGEMAYMPMNNSIIITHTGVSLDYRGQGLAEKLVLAGIQKARREQLKLGATCLYAVKYFREHKEELTDVLK